MTTAASCADAIATTRAHRRVVDLDVRTANAPVDLSIGDVLRIRLPASPATGHAWTLDANVPAFLCLESDPGNRAVNAAAPLDTWTFRAHGAGRGTVQFSFGRHGVPGPEGPRTALFDVRVARVEARQVAPAR
jgi:predicted secreted protein